MSGVVTVRPLGRADEVRWDGFVRRHGQGTLFHLPAWSSAVEQVYGHQPMHLAAWSDDALAGVLPMFLVRSAFVGRVLVSVPYATYGGILADSPQASMTLLAAAQDLARVCDARYLELRHRHPSGLDLPSTDRYHSFHKLLPQDPSQVLDGIPRKERAACRKGLERLGPNCASVGPQGIGAIYDLYVRTLRRLGSPPYRRRLFQALLHNYGDECVCMLVRDGSEPVAGAMCFVFRDEIVPYFAGSSDRGMALHANNVMYLRLMEHAAGGGLKVFDFNRTRRDNLGCSSFKRNMGFEASPLHYQFFLNRCDEIPNLSPSNGKFALAAKAWRKMPLWLTRLAGSRLTKWIP